MKKVLSLRSILIVIALGVWANVLQTAGVIPTSQKVQVTNTVDTYVNGGNLQVKGDVDINGTVDVDIKKINGWNAANYKEYSLSGEEFHSLGTR